jgi:alpha-mannosidase II
MFLCRCLQYKALRVCLFQMRFSTLGSYMIAAKDALEHKKSDSPEIPSLSGDFLMYSDRSDQYWTGFYSSRPLLKRLARLLQCCLRLLADAYFL